MLRNLTLIAVLAGTAMTGAAHAPLTRSTISSAGRALSQLNRVLPPVKTTVNAADVPEPMNVPARAAANTAPYSLPFSMAPTKEQMTEECIIIDNNNDSSGNYNAWTYSDYFDAPIYWANNPAGDADDWLIFPAFKVEDISKVYRVSIGARSTVNVGEHFEGMELRIGTAPTVSALSRVVLSEPMIEYNNGEYKTYEGNVGLAQPGNYYVAVRCNSAADTGFRLLIKNLKVEMTEMSTSVPGQCASLSAEPLIGTSVKARVNFTMPEYSINGSKLPADQQLTAEVKTSVETITVTGTPGESKTVDIAAVDGMNTITVTVSNTFGTGETTSTSARCGIDIPADPVVTSTISDDNMSLTLSWEPVTTGYHGGTVDPTDITYDIYFYDSSTENWGIVAADLPYTQTTFTASAAPGSSLAYYDLAVGSKNSKGFSESIPVISELLGTPYALPVNETLEGQTLHYVGLTIDTPDDSYNARFGSVDPSQLDEAFANENNAAFVGMAQDYAGGRGHITLPKFSTVGCGPVQVILPIFLYSGLPSVRVYAHLNNGTSIDLGEVDKSLGSGWTSVPFNMPGEFQGKQCVSVSLDITFENNAQTFLLSGYTVREGVVNDFEVTSITSNPTPIMPGEKATFTATLTNMGMNPASAPALSGTITAAGKKIADLTFVPTSTEPVSLNQKVTYTAEYTVNSAQHVGSTFNITATIDNSDENLENNMLTVQVPVSTVEQPIITDLRANFNDEDGSIVLSWSNPVTNEVVEGFEFLPAFSFDSQLGSWLNIDFDGAATYTIEDEHVAIPNDTDAKAFQVISAQESGLSSLEITGFNGTDQFLMAFSAQETASDDWFISPEVMGGSDLSLMWDIVTSEFPETIEIYTSSTDREIDSFKTKVGTYTKSKIGWEELAVILPDDARYFAIHYCSYDSFGVMIDDITYYPAELNYSINGYSVLRNEETIATLPAEATGYIDTTAERDAYYTYHVVPTFLHNETTMEGLRSNPVSLAAAGVFGIAAGTSDIRGGKGVIVIEGHQGETIEVFDLQGRRVATVEPHTTSTTLQVAPGFYVAGGRKLIVK